MELAVVKAIETVSRTSQEVGDADLEITFGVIAEAVKRNKLTSLASCIAEWAMDNKLGVK